MADPEWATFFKYDKIPEKELLGYDLQVEAGIGIGLAVAMGGCQSALVFGYPGTGKSDYPFVIARLINEDFDSHYSVAEIKCDKMAAMIDQPAKACNSLNKFLKKISDAKPLLIGFDEVEAAVPPIEEVVASRVILSQWMRDYMSESQEKTFLLGITNYPKRVDAAVFRRFRIPIYFEPTSDSVIQQLFTRHLGLDRCKEITKLFLTKIAKFNLRPNGAEVIIACKAVIESSSNLEDLSSGQIAELLLCNCPLGSFGGLETYESGYEGLIQFSLKHILPYWRSVYMEYARTEKESDIAAETSIAYEI